MKHAIHESTHNARRFLPLIACVLAGCTSDPLPEQELEVAQDAVEALPATASTEKEPEAEPRDYGRPYETIEGEPMFKILEEDGIPAIDDPVFVSAEEADTFMDLDETVLGVVGADGTAKCYSAWQLDSHEIVNDVLDGEPIAATW